MVTLGFLLCCAALIISYVRVVIVGTALHQHDHIWLWYVINYIDQYLTNNYEVFVYMSDAT